MRGVISGRGCARLAMVAVVVAALLGSRGAVAVGSADGPGSISLEPFIDRGFALSPTWDDGKAEVSRYVGRETRRGLARDADWVVILRREIHRPGGWVAADDVAAPSVDRAAAAIALSQAEPAVRGRLRVAAEASAEARLRIALESSDEANPEELAATLAALEREPNV